jgi:hypothetical protein
MMLEPERAARLVAERLRRPASGGAFEGRGRAPEGGRSSHRSGADPAGSGQGPGAEASAAGASGAADLAGTAGPNGGMSKDWLVRRTLEELGIHCEADAGLQDLKGFMIASPRGAEIVVSERLGPDERLGVYAHLLAHALLENPELQPDGAFYSRLEYVEGRRPKATSAERRAEMVADALAKAILRGRLDGAPQYAYKHKRGGVAGPGLRPRLGRMLLEICHRTSLALFWLSPKYQRLRGRPEMSALVRRVEGLVKVAYAC